MASTGNLFPGTGENVNRIGQVWSNPSRITADDNSLAGGFTLTGGSDYLVARNFDFSAIPAGATIVGITVRVEANESSSGSEDLFAQLQDASAALIGSSKTLSLTTPLAVYTYGGTSDTWGATLTHAMLQDADFGVRLWFATSHNVSIDYVTMAVEYTVPTYGISTETDTAIALSTVKLRAVGQSSETDSALALSGRKVFSVGRADETDSAFALSALKSGAVGVAMESDSALALSGTKIAAVGLASETDDALALSAAKLHATGLASEDSTAFALTALKIAACGSSDETDTALALTATKLAAVAQTSETDIALSLAGTKLFAVGRADETDEAFALEGEIVDASPPPIAGPGRIVRASRKNRDIEAEIKIRIARSSRKVRSVD